MTSGKLSPGSVCFDLGFAPAVIVGRDIGVDRRSLSFQVLLSKKFVQDCRLGVGVPPAGFLVQVREILRRQCECTAEFARTPHMFHIIYDNTMSMILFAADLRPET